MKKKKIFRGISKIENFLIKRNNLLTFFQKKEKKKNNNFLPSLKNIDIVCGRPLMKLCTRNTARQENETCDAVTHRKQPRPSIGPK